MDHVIIYLCLLLLITVLPASFFGLPFLFVLLELNDIVYSSKFSIHCVHYFVQFTFWLSFVGAVELFLKSLIELISKS